LVAGYQLGYPTYIGDSSVVVGGSLAVQITAKHEGIPGKQLIQYQWITNTKQLRETIANLIGLMVRENISLEGEVKPFHPCPLSCIHVDDRI
jgi:hypothetical protein